METNKQRIEDLEEKVTKIIIVLEKVVAIKIWSVQN